MRLRHLAATLVLLAVPALAAAQNVYIVHAIPGGDLGLDPTLPVDVCTTGGTALLQDVTFGGIAPVTLDPGFYQLNIWAANPGAPCSGFLAVPVSFAVSVAESSTIVAHLSEQGTATFSKFVNDLRALADGNGRVVVRHAASAPPVDVQLKGRSRPAFIRDLRNPDQSVSADVPAGAYRASVMPAAGGRRVFGPADIDVAAGQALFIHAVGSLATGSFTVIPLVVAVP